MNDDTISRQSAIAYAISGRIRTLPTTEDGEDWIRVSEVRESLIAVPSAPRWIPVTERLPKKWGDYLVCDNCQNIYVNEWITTTTTWSWHYDDGRITAWMPLPDPWKGE